MEGHVISLKNGQTATVFNLKDVLEIVDFYCGFDMRNVLRDGIRDLQAENEELEMKNRDYQNTIECNNEEERELLLAVRDECDALLDELVEQRLSRRKMQKITKNIYRLVNDEL